MAITWTCGHTREPSDVFKSLLKFIIKGTPIWCGQGDVFFMFASSVWWNAHICHCKVKVLQSSIELQEEEEKASYRMFRTTYLHWLDCTALKPVQCNPKRWFSHLKTSVRGCMIISQVHRCVHVIFKMTLSEHACFFHLIQSVSRF